MIGLTSSWLMTYWVQKYLSCKSIFIYVCMRKGGGVSELSTFNCNSRYIVLVRGSRKIQAPSWLVSQLLRKSFLKDRADQTFCEVSYHSWTCKTFVLATLHEGREEVWWLSVWWGEKLNISVIVEGSVKNELILRKLKVEGLNLEKVKNFSHEISKLIIFLGKEPVFCY